MKCIVSFTSVLLIVLIMSVIAVIIITTTSGGCPSTSFRCDENNMCISKVKKCDKVQHCPNGSDEAPFRCNNFQGLPESFADVVVGRKRCKTATNTVATCENLKRPEPCICQNNTWIVCENTSFEHVNWDLFGGGPTKMFLYNVLQDDWKEVGKVPEFTELNTLFIEENLHMRHLPRSLFENTPGICNAYLANNSVEVIESKMFQNNKYMQILDLNWNSIYSIEKGAFYGLKNLYELHLSHNQINLEPLFQFQWIPNLQHLYLEHNKLEVIGDRYFRDLPNLTVAYLQSNLITEIHPRAFRYNLILRQIHLENNLIRTLDNDLLNGLSNLRTFNIAKNPINYIPAELFRSTPELTSLDLSGTDLHSIDLKLYSILSNLRFMYPVPKDPSHCELLPKVLYCDPKDDVITSLLNGTLLQTFAWIIALTIMLGNAFVLLSRWLSSTDNLILDVFIKNLAGADFLMGLYLMILGIKDVQYEDTFTSYSYHWSSSWGCTVTGFVGMTSSEVSLLILTVMSLDRYLVIGSPYSDKKLSKNWAMASMSLVWIFAIFLSILPAFMWKTSYFGTSPLCFTMHLDDAFSIGWEYSAFIFIGLNSICLICIAVFYGRLFWVVRQTSSSTPLVAKDVEMTIRFFLMVLTDFLCWVPVIVLKIMVSRGYVLPRKFLPWISIFVLPVNSAVNPMLYTFSTASIRKRMFKSVFSKNGTIRKRQRNMPESIEAKLMSPEITTDDSKIHSSAIYGTRNTSLATNVTSMMNQDSTISNFSGDD